MKLLIVGSDKIFSIENFYIKYLKELGVNVKFFTGHAIFIDYYYGGNIFRKILFKIGLSNILNKINQDFLEKVSEFKPDIVFVFKGMELLPSSLFKIKKLGIKLVNYNPDNPFIFSGRGSGNKNITNSIALYDLHFTYDTTIKQRIELEYSIPCKILPFGFDIDENLYKECLQEDEVIKVCFLGNPDKQRATFINSLLDKGVQIDLYGNSWNKFIHSTNATIFDAVYDKDFWKTLRKYRVQLNIMRVHNPTSHNMRSFEVPSIGGVMLAPDTEDHHTYFTPNEEIFLYTSIDECVEKIRTILNTSVQHINIVRDKARAKSISLGYSYKDRAAYIVDVLKEMGE